MDAIDNKARGAALERIEESFSVSRRVLVPLIIIVTAGFACIPIMDQASASTLSLVAGVITLVVGIAVRPVIENLMAGLMISHSRTINIGDTVLLAGQYGTIEDIATSHTTLKTWTGNRYLIPNGKLLTLECENLSLTDEAILTHVEFVVGYDADLEKVEEITCDAARMSECFDDREPPRFWYSELRPEGAVCWVAAWARTPGESWAFQSEMRRSIMLAFQKHSIPVHSHRLHLNDPNPRAR
jgi:small-conductance mechanosensitive channel